LAPLIRNAVSARSNILFVAVTVPRNGSWLLQVMKITPSTGTKLRRLLDADKEEPTKEASTNEQQPYKQETPVGHRGNSCVQLRVN
jgi:hypothetical protein